MAKYDLTIGVQQKAVRCVIYGTAGVGKTTLAAQFPNPVFIDVEDGSNQLPVARMPRPTSWDMLLDEAREVRAGNIPCSTLVIDTADAAEELCVRAACAENGWDSIESPGYGKGHVYVNEKFARLLDLLGEIVDGGRNVVVISHAVARKFERPDESGAYDRFELKLNKKNSPMLKEWSDMLLFLDYKIYVEEDSNGKAKAKGGKRIIRTTYHPCWDAKNRFGLPDEMPLSYDGLAPYVPDMMLGGRTVEMKPTESPKKPAEAPKPSPAIQEVDERIERMDADLKAAGMAQKQLDGEPDPCDTYPDHCKALVDLMRADGITDEMLRRAVGSKGYFVKECPVANYPADFVRWLVGVWESFVPVAKELD